MKEDAVFALIFVASLGIGYLLPSVDAASRSGAAGALGATLVALACGLRWALYPLLTSMITAAALAFAPRRLHGPLCFAAAFGSLAVLRLCDSPPGAANAVQLVLTLRLASVGFDSADGGLPCNQGPLRLLQYAFCYHGLFSGPFYPWAEWAAAMGAPAGVPLQPAERRQVWCAVRDAAITLCVWRGVAWLTPYARLSEPGWAAQPRLWRLCYFYLSSFQFRFRFYARARGRARAAPCHRRRARPERLAVGLCARECPSRERRGRGVLSLQTNPPTPLLRRRLLPLPLQRTRGERCSRSPGCLV